MDSTKTSAELRRELEELKEINEQEKRNLEREERELREAQDRLAKTKAEQRQMELQLDDVLGQIMQKSCSQLSESVFDGIAGIAEMLAKPDPVAEAQQQELARLDEELKKLLDKLTGTGLDEELQRVQEESAAMKALLREKEAELQRLKNIKEKNRKKFAERKKQRRQEIEQMTAKYNTLHAKVMAKKYGGTASPESQLLDDDSE